MLELATSAIKLADKILDVHKMHHKNKYKRKLHKLSKELEHELSKPDHLKTDSIIDDINFELCMLLNIFSEEIGAESISKKNVPTLH
jgi:hypothetical protein|tara:strand:+ start:4373 stop:4633 length:261 start_codon:yes stop_codon:yes gene_type:complete